MGLGAGPGERAGHSRPTLAEYWTGLAQEDLPAAVSRRARARPLPKKKAAKVKKVKAETGATGFFWSHPVLSRQGKKVSAFGVPAAPPGGARLPEAYSL